MLHYNQWDGNDIIIEGGACEHCVVGILLNLNPTLEVILIVGIEKKNEGMGNKLSFSRQLGSKTSMARSCPWF
jgi:hypothetical protein